MNKQDKINYIQKIADRFCLDLDLHGELEHLNDKELDTIVENCEALEEHDKGYL